MDEEKESIVERLKTLKDRLANLERQNEELRASVDELQQRLAVSRNETVSLRSQYTRLKLAKAYGWDEKSKRAATLKINGILHEIDSCLALLRQDVNI